MASLEEIRALAQAIVGQCDDLLNPPLLYTARTDRFIQEKPPLPVLGPAGFAFTDPAFGSPMWRVTDAQTSGGSSLRVPSSAHATAWNSNGTMFYVVNEGGGAIFFGFDGQTVTQLPYAITSQLEPQFSFDHPNLIFGVSGHQVKTWTVSTGQSGIQLDLDSVYSNLPLTNTYVGGILLADQDIWACHFGGAGIDQHVFVHHSGLGGLLDVRPLGWKIHAISIDRTGRYVLVYPANDPNTGQLPVGVSQVYRWDTQTQSLTPITTRPAGHDSLGYGLWVNQDAEGAWDASQWQIRDLATPAVTSNLIQPVLTPQAIYLAEHSNWRAAKPDIQVPIISINYRYGAGLNQTAYPWRAWDEEIIAIATDGSGTVWRFAHHRSVNPHEFWNQPMPNVSPDGRFCLFTSNWGNLTPNARQDVFLVELT